MTEIDQVYHIERGYEGIVQKLSKLGADIHEKSFLRRLAQQQQRGLIPKSPRFPCPAPGPALPKADCLWTVGLPAVHFFFFPIL